MNYGGGFPSLFAGMNVQHMAVNMNFGGPNPLTNPNGLNPANHVGYADPTTPQLAYDAVPVEEIGPKSFGFDKISIDANFKLHFSEGFDFKGNKPKTRHSPVNEHYQVINPGDACKDDPYGMTFAKIEDRKDHPPILTILDLEFIEADDQYIIDQFVYHTALLAKHGNFKKFFMVLEESGEKEDGEPFVSLVRSNKGLFRKTIYSVSFDH